MKKLLIISIIFILTINNIKAKKIKMVYALLDTNGKYQTAKPPWAEVFTTLAFLYGYHITHNENHYKTFLELYNYLKEKISSDPWEWHCDMNDNIGWLYREIIYNKKIHSKKDYPMFISDTKKLFSHLKKIYKIKGENKWLNKIPVPHKYNKNSEIRWVVGVAEFLMAYRKICSIKEKKLVDKMAQNCLDKILKIQIDKKRALSEINEKWIGAFPHWINGKIWLNIGNHDPLYLSLDNLLAIQCMARGYGLYKKTKYLKSAAAGSRILLDPKNGGEITYKITYMASPNAFATIAATFKILLQNNVYIPKDQNWLNNYWKNKPAKFLFNYPELRKYWNNKIKFILQKFLPQTQLPCSKNLEWIDKYPSVGKEATRIGGWFDGSGRGTMKSSYNSITIIGYTIAGGKDKKLISNALKWFKKLIVYEKE